MPGKNFEFMRYVCLNVYGDFIVQQKGQFWS